MNTIWVKAVPWNKKLVTTALEGGADAVMVEEGRAAEVKELGRVDVIAPDGDMVPDQDVFEVRVMGQEDEDAVIQALQKGRVVVDAPDWSIIPLENLIAKGAQVVAKVNNLEDAVTAAGILEHGVWGILVDTDNPGELKKILSELREAGTQTPMVTARIVSIKPLGMGDRVCVDTCTNMGMGEGMLVGNASSGMFLVHAESIENPYVAPRPFRVNAGAVHAYTRAGGGKTKYLAELASGDEVQVIDYKGKTGPAIVGRVKIERRPLLLVTAEHEGEEFSVVLQNAETIRLVDEKGQPASVVKLAAGDKVMAAVEEGGRHFGMKIKERITEK